MFALGLFTTASYWPGIFSPAMTPRWIALSLIAPALLLYRQQPVILTRAHIAGLAFILWAALTTFWSAAPLDTLNALWQVAILGAICFLLGSQTPSLRPFFIAASVGMALSGAVSTAQLAGWIDLSTITMPSGLFTNRIPMGEAAAIVLIWLIAERMWWWALLPLPAYILSDARGATLALTVGLGVLLWKRPSWLIGGLLLVNLVLLAHGVSTHPTATMVERGTIWHETAGGISLLGNGFGAFGGVQHALQLDNTVPQHAHNDALELLWETGIIGFCLLLIFMRQLFGPLNASRLVLIVFAVEGCFGFPAYLPATLCLVGVAAGHAVRDRAVVRGLARSRRDFSYPRRARAKLRQGHVAAYHGRAGHADKPAVS